MQNLNLILERIRTMVDESGLSYTTIAASCGVSEKTVSRVLQDDPGKNPSFLLLCGIVTACGGSVDEVIGNAPSGPRIVVSDVPLVKELRETLKLERDRGKTWSVLFVVLAFGVIALFVYDAFNPHIGWIRYSLEAALYNAETAGLEILRHIVSWVTGHAV